MVITKSEDVTKQGFCKILWGKLRLREGLLLSLIWVCVGGRWGGVGAYSRLGVYSRWALIRGWALIRINTRPAPHPPPPLISRPNGGPKGWKKFFWRPGPPLSKGLDILELHMLRPQGYAVCPYTFRRELQNTKFVNLIVSVECGTTLNLLNFMGHQDREKKWWSKGVKNHSLYFCKTHLRNGIISSACHRQTSKYLCPRKKNKQT